MEKWLFLAGWWIEMGRDEEVESCLILERIYFLDACSSEYSLMYELIAAWRLLA